MTTDLQTSQIGAPHWGLYEKRNREAVTKGESGRAGNAAGLFQLCLCFVHEFKTKRIELKQRVHSRVFGTGVGLRLNLLSDDQEPIEIGSGQHEKERRTKVANGARDRHPCVGHGELAADQCDPVARNPVCGR